MGFSSNFKSTSFGRQALSLFVDFLEHIRVWKTLLWVQYSCFTREGKHSHRAERWLPQYKPGGQWQSLSPEILTLLFMQEGPGAGGEGNDRGWDGWMASPTRWAWVWVSSGSWWWTGRTGMLRFMGSQRVGHDGVTELNWLNVLLFKKYYRAATM